MSDTTRAFMLDGPMVGAFIEAIHEEFPAPPEFISVVLRRLNRKFERTAQSARYEQNIYYFLMAVNDDCDSGRLLTALLAERPASPSLLRFAMSIGYLPSTRNAAALEAITRDRAAFGNTVAEAEWLLRVTLWVCKIEIPGSGGTGVLVGPDLVLTNEHVAAQFGDLSTVSCIFDYHVLPDGVTVNAGRRVTLDPAWTIVSRPHSASDLLTHPPQAPAAHELDYALLRLAEPIGLQSIQRGQNGSVRGWTKLNPAPPTVLANDDVRIFQHPQPQNDQQLPLKSTFGRILACPWPAVRMRYDANTLPGASGSPCFNARFELVALHHAGEPGWISGGAPAAYNQAIPISAILADLSGRGVAAFWTEPIPIAAARVVIAPPPVGAEALAIDNGTVETPLDIATGAKDPTNALLISSAPMLPFFNRARLRRNLEDVAADQSQFKAMSIMGLKGAGCSSSWQLIRRVAQNRGIVAGMVDFSMPFSLRDACEEITRTLKLDAKEMMQQVLIDDPAPDRIARKFASFLAGALADAPKRHWLVCDSLDRSVIDRDVRDKLFPWLLDYSIRDEIPALVLIFIGQMPPQFDRLAGLYVTESVESVSRLDLETFFKAWVTLHKRQLTGDALERTLDKVTAGRPGPYHGTELGDIRRRTGAILEALVKP